MDFIYDIFCDASVGADLRGACAGCIVVRRGDDEYRSFTIVQPNGTNNSGELEAIALAITIAIQIKSMHTSLNIPFTINIFSDSQISIKGLRDWIFGWSYNNNVHYKKDGSVVMNQNFIKLIYNLIMTYDLRVNFYHQKGHVGHAFHKAEKTFHQSNGIYCGTLGLTAEYISIYNDLVDNLTRDTLLQWSQSGEMANSENFIINYFYEFPIDHIGLIDNFNERNKYRQLIGQ